MVWLFTAFLFLGLFEPAWGQTVRPPAPSELASYLGSDRERILYDGAKQEGKVVWYTSLVSHQEIARIFESKYPGVTLETYRSSGMTVATRVLAETQSKRRLVDDVETTPGALMLLRDNKLLAPFASPYLANYPEIAKEKAPGNLVYWASDRESYNGVGYNKNALRAAEVPKSFDDLLKPILKGRIGIVSEESGARMIGAMIRVKGDGFVRKLRGQNIVLHGMTAIGLNGLVVTGEVPVTFTSVNTNIAQAAEKGAPVAWVPMDLVPANAGGAAVYLHAQHPHAALLFTDFLFSPAGQKMLEKLGYGSASRDYGFKRWYPEQGLSTYDYVERSERWQKLIAEITRK
jgi:iron(III) transport system substrate-binding protein